MSRERVIKGRTLRLEAPQCLNWWSTEPCVSYLTVFSVGVGQNHLTRVVFFSSSEVCLNPRIGLFSHDKKLLLSPVFSSRLYRLEASFSGTFTVRRSSVRAQTISVWLLYFFFYIQKTSCVINPEKPSVQVPKKTCHFNLCLFQLWSALFTGSLVPKQIEKKLFIYLLYLFTQENVNLDYTDCSKQWGGDKGGQKNCKRTFKLIKNFCVVLSGF